VVDLSEISFRCRGLRELGPECGNREMLLSDLIEARDVVIGIHAPDIEAAAAQLLRQTLPRRGFASIDVERLVSAVLEREREAPTICGAIAIPHGRDPLLSSFVAAIGINARGLIEESPVPRVMIAFISPDGKRAEHLGLLSSVARLGRDDPAVASIAGAVSAEEVVRLIRP
jgi:mannitol/fructose-specific phosphotransferase system IIA component (Ntr-type)